MRYTELTKKELQREYTKLTRRYTDFVREPLELDMTAEDTFGKSESRRAARHFGTVLGKELSDTGAAQPRPGRGCGCRPGYHAGLRLPYCRALPPGRCPVRCHRPQHRIGAYHSCGRAVRRVDPRRQCICHQRTPCSPGKPAERVAFLTLLPPKNKESQPRLYRVHSDAGAAGFLFTFACFSLIPTAGGGTPAPRYSAGGGGRRPSKPSGTG